MRQEGKDARSNNAAILLLDVVYVWVGERAWLSFIQKTVNTESLLLFISAMQTTISDLFSAEKQLFGGFSLECLPQGTVGFVQSRMCESVS